MALAGDAGFTPNIGFVTEDYVTTLKLVAERLGAALLPRMAIDASPDVAGVVTAPTRPQSYREIFLALPSDPAPAAMVFAELLTGGVAAST